MKDSDISIVIMLHRLNHHMYNRHNEILSEHDITVQQSRVLKYILSDSKKQFVNQKDIENAMNLKGSSVSSLIKTMIDKGLIVKSQNPLDGRYYNLTVTEKGKEIDKIAFNIFKEFNVNLINGINENVLNHFKDFFSESFFFFFCNDY